MKGRTLARLALGYFLHLLHFLHFSAFFREVVVFEVARVFVDVLLCQDHRSLVVTVQVLLSPAPCLLVASRRRVSLI